jgi:hypothetical protein
MEWGPYAWKLLHGIGARAGRSSEKLRKDEDREAIWLIKNLESIIPCAECRKHIAAYKKESTPKRSEEIGEWIWKFHEAVNERLNKPRGPSFTQELGMDTDLKEAWNDYNKVMKKELIVGNCVAEKYNQWLRHFNLWRTFL